MIRANALRLCKSQMTRSDDGGPSFRAKTYDCRADTCEKRLHVTGRAFCTTYGAMTPEMNVPNQVRTGICTASELQLNTREMDRVGVHIQGCFA
jgi:hypothetical protein